MNFFVTLAIDGTVTGLYTDAPGYAAPPPESVAVPWEIGEALRLAAGPKLYINGVLSDAPPPPPPTPPTNAELVAQVLAEARAQRLPIMQVLDGMQVSAVVMATQIIVGGLPVALSAAIETSKQGLRDITTTDLSLCTTLAEMRAAIYNAYLALAAAAPAQVQSAFQSLVP